MVLGLPHPKQAALTLRRISRILWVRVAVISALSFIAALSAEILDPLLPETSKGRFTAETTLPVLNILASGMLAVATFSLGVMVSSHRALAVNTTPRIHRLLMEDTSTQSMLATFIGAFVFSLVSIILFRANYYSESAAIIVFAATVFLVVAIVVSLVRWIHKLSRIGSIDYALERAEDTARGSLASYGRAPFLGAKPLTDGGPVPKGAAGCEADNSGFVQRVDIGALQSCAEAHDARIYVLVLPGDHILAGEIIARVDGTVPRDEIAAAFTIGTTRNFEQDPRFGLQVLRETATKALSPGINDPGTAVEVVTRLETLLHDLFRNREENPATTADRVFVRALRPETLVAIAFRDIARDGAAFVDVLTSVVRALHTMRRHGGDAVCASVDAQLEELEEHADKELRTGAERARFKAALTQVGTEADDDGYPTDERQDI